MSDFELNLLFSDVEKASQHLAKGQRTDALLIYQDVKERAGSHAPVQYELGRLCEKMGDVVLAITHYKIANKESADNVPYLSALGIAQLNAGDLDLAIETLERAEALDPRHLDVLQGLGAYYMQRGDNAKALEYLETAHNLKPGNARIRINLAVTLAHLNEYERALELARKAAKSDDSNPDTSYSLCNMMAQVGKMEEATMLLEKVILKHSTFGPAYDLLARIKKFTAQDERFIRKTEKVLDRGMPATHRYRLHYALGKMHDDCGLYDEAFSHYQQANILQRTDFNLSKVGKRSKAMRTAFTSKTLRSFESLGHSSAQPVFIVGMPRSGTTLMEQMIASHPDGGGAGELVEMQHISDCIFPDNDRLRVTAQLHTNLTAEKCKEYAEAYLKVLQQRHPDTPRIVDKAPNNYQFIGLIATLFPNATIIHAVRHPLDTCLSCYFQSFSDFAWANDYATLAGIYSLYRETMDYWRSALPTVNILDVHYEQLIENPEIEGRRMLEACGLKWDNAILDYSGQDNIIKTASVAQARQPVYKSSRSRWHNYSQHIDELAVNLSQYLDEDREHLAELGINLGKRGGRSWIKQLLG